jgi:amino acid transporter
MAHGVAFPPVIARLHATTRTPWVEIVLTLIAAGVFVFLGDARAFLFVF